MGHIEGLEIGPLLGHGSFGSVHMGRWNGALVAVKTIETRVQGGRLRSVSREPLLRWAHTPLQSFELLVQGNAWGGWRGCRAAGSGRLLRWRIECHLVAAGKLSPASFPTSSTLPSPLSLPDGLLQRRGEPPLRGHHIQAVDLLPVAGGAREGGGQQQQHPLLTASRQQRRRMLQRRRGLSLLEQRLGFLQ